MNIRIYSIEYPQPVADDIWQGLLRLLPGDIIQKVGKYRRWEDAHGSLFGKHLLQVALWEAGFSGDLSGLQYSAYGRPYLADGPDFNISHSGTRVACVVGVEGKVGLDLEEIRDLDITDFRGQFSALEWEAIQGAPEPLTAFYHYWTAKECLSKADGRGLNLPLADLRIETNTAIQLDGRSWNMTPVDFFEGYACHIATEKQVYQTELKELDALEVLLRIKNIFN